MSSVQSRVDGSNLERYCQQAVEKGATHAKQVHPSSIITAPWVRLKCQFGCPRYNRGYCCPPYTPVPDQTRAIIDCYARALLFHFEAIKTSERGKGLKAFYEMLVDLEGEVFKDGYYKAFIFLSGPCRLCDQCSASKQEPCIFPYRARPSMEGCGIDVYQSARNNGFLIHPLRERSEAQNHFCLMLVD